MGNYSAPIKEVIDRLTFHTGSGQLLAGLKFRSVPQAQVDGRDDLPNLTLMAPRITEGYRVDNIVGRITVELGLSVERANGMEVLMQWVEKVLDALEMTGSDPTIYNPNLKSMKPFEASVPNTFALDLSLNAHITITIEPKPRHRGNRRATVNT